MIHHTTLAIFLSCVAGITKKDYRNVAAFHIIHPFFPTYVSGNATYLKEVQIEIRFGSVFLLYEFPSFLIFSDTGSSY